MWLRSTAFLLVLSTGCWPRIPGQWKDYNVPDETILLGQMYWLEPMGDYWTSGDASGAAWWALLDPPTPMRSEDVYGQPDVCVLDHTSPELEPLFANGGSGTARLMQGDHEVRLTWDSSIDWYAGLLEEGDFIFDATYDLAPIEFEPHGTLEIEDLVKTPSDFTLDAPLLDTETAPNLTADQLVFEWSGDGGESPCPPIPGRSGAPAASCSSASAPSRKPPHPRPSRRAECGSALCTRRWARPT
ncbi:MAG: hypothetical protein JRI25_19955, partial [Deltaproteobacteria bacterium]|nr:hypothetical protein [Deltaproteobacteria bacterium]